MSEDTPQELISGPPPPPPPPIKEEEVSVDFTPVDLPKLTNQFSLQYAFNYFDRNNSQTITIKDLHLILNAQGINPTSPSTISVFKQANISTTLTDTITFDKFEALLKTLSPTLPSKEEINDACKIISEFFGNYGTPGNLTVEQANKMMVFGENRLTTAQLNQISTLAATSGAERGGNVNLKTLLSLNEVKN